MSSLYLTHFGLVSPPFSITPDPSFFFEGKDRGVFSAGLLHATLQGEGLVLVIGEVGSGKTLMCRLLLTQLPKYVDTVYLPNPSFSRDEIIEVIARDLGVDRATLGQGSRLEALQQELIRRHQQSRRVVVVIDEAHAMPPESIEEVRRLSNLETDNHKLVQVVLCGQPELDALLDKPHLRQVRDRVVYRLALDNFSSEDSRAYLEHRLRVAGWRGGRMFTWFAERLLLSDAKGRARRLNILADKALLAAFADGKNQVLARHVRRAINDAGANFASRMAGGGKPWGLAIAWAVSLVLAAAATLWFARSPMAPEAAAVAQAPQVAKVAMPSKPPLMPPDPEPIPQKTPTPESKAAIVVPPAPAETTATASANEAPAAPAVSKSATGAEETAAPSAASAPEPAGDTEAVAETNATLAPQLGVSGGQAEAAPPTEATTPPVSATVQAENSQDEAATAGSPQAGVETGTPPPPAEEAVESQPAATTGDEVAAEPRATDIDSRVSRSHDYAVEQSALGHYAIRLGALPDPRRASELIANADRLLSADQIHVRRFAEERRGGQTSYVLYYGSFATASAARQAMAGLPERLYKEKPTIRTWREISDAPWSL